MLADNLFSQLEANIYKENGSISSAAFKILVQTEHKSL
jgi:hypothetical protein